MNITDFHPDFEAKTSEPSLREIIFRYYAQHFDKEKALVYTNRYCEQILHEINSQMMFFVEKK